jgi:hypothetical protein
MFFIYEGKVIPTLGKNVKSMINENGSEINRIKYVFLRKKPCILGNEGWGSSSSISEGIVLRQRIQSD